VIINKEDYCHGEGAADYRKIEPVIHHHFPVGLMRKSTAAIVNIALNFP